MPPRTAVGSSPGLGVAGRRYPAASSPRARLSCCGTSGCRPGTRVLASSRASTPQPWGRRPVRTRGSAAWCRF